MKCPKCNSENWRAEVRQSVDVTLDKDFNVIENGFSFSDPEIQKDSVICNTCGFEPKAEITKDEEVEIIKIDKMCCGKKMLEISEPTPLQNIDKEICFVCLECGSRISYVEEQIDEEEIEQYKETYEVV